MTRRATLPGSSARGAELLHLAAANTIHTALERDDIESTEGDGDGEGYTRIHAVAGAAAFAAARAGTAAGAGAGPEARAGAEAAADANAEREALLNHLQGELSAARRELVGARAAATASAERNVGAAMVANAMRAGAQAGTNT